MRKPYLLLFVLLFSFKAWSCSCDCIGDCSFSVVSDNLDFVALVKVVEFTDYLDLSLPDHPQMPNAMIVEVVKKYKGKESRTRIKIWGDNGMQCRPYIANFQLGKHYLIAPSLGAEEQLEDYYLYVCHTDYLEVDLKKQKAFGAYAKNRSRVSLKKFEQNLKG